MRVAIVLGALALAGCAGTPAEQVSDFELCRYTMRSGNDAMTAQREARRRGLDCAPLYPAILAREQQRTNALNQAAQHFNRPPPPSPAHPVNCTSYRVGNTVETTCR
jgi:hypothetical protein